MRVEGRGLGEELRCWKGGRGEGLEAARNGRVGDLGRARVYGAREDEGAKAD